MIFKENSIIPLELRIIDLFGQEKTNISSVSVRIFHRVAGSIVEDLAPTTMSGSGSVWYYSYNSSLTVGKYVVEYTITDTDTEEYIQTEELTIGYLEPDINGIPTLAEIEASSVLAKEATLTAMQTDIELIKQVETGRWKIDTSVNQMIFYNSSNVEILRFNLTDDKGLASSTAVFERTRV